MGDVAIGWLGEKVIVVSEVGGEILNTTKKAFEDATSPAAASAALRVLEPGGAVSLVLVSCVLLMVLRRWVIHRSASAACAHHAKLA